METSKNRKDDTMMKNTLGKTIARLRKEQSMTQLELAEKMGVTDKAVSKWERDLSCPDTPSLPKLAQVLGTSVDELMNAGTVGQEKEPAELPLLICRAVGLAMGVAVVVLSVLKQLDPPSAAGMLGVGLTALSIGQFLRK